MSHTQDSQWLQIWVDVPVACGLWIRTFIYCMFVIPISDVSPVQSDKFSVAPVYVYIFSLLVIIPNPNPTFPLGSQ